MPQPPRVPAYVALRDHIRHSLRDSYGDNEPLPTEAALAEQHRVSRQTVRRAMQALVDEGLIYRVAGRGTFLVDPKERFTRQVGSVEDLMSLTLDTEAEVISPLRPKADIETAGRLRLASDNIMSVTFKRFHLGTPICVTTASMSLEIGAVLLGVEMLTTAGSRGNITIFGLIEEHTDVVIREADQSMTAVAAPAFVTEHLTCEAGSPMLRVDRLYSDREGVPVELASTYFDPQYYSYRIRLQSHANGRPR